VDASELARRFEEEALPRIRRMVSETERFLYLIAWLNTALERACSEPTLSTATRLG